MSLFQNRILQMFSALVALLVFSGDVLDDVWNMPGSAVPTHSSHQHKGGAAKANSPGHDDTVTVGSALASPTLMAPRAVRYLDVDEDAPVGAPPAIDHPPQLA